MSRVLAIIIGSSSLKAALYQMSEQESLVLSLDVSRSRVKVRVIKTNEELMIARHAYKLLS